MIFFSRGNSFPFFFYRESRDREFGISQLFSRVTLRNSELNFKKRTKIKLKGAIPPCLLFFLSSASTDTSGRTRRVIPNGYRMLIRCGAKLDASRNIPDVTSRDVSQLLCCNVTGTEKLASTPLLPLPPLSWLTKRSQGGGGIG